jgi:hypothetical protein
MLYCLVSLSFEVSRFPGFLKPGKPRKPAKTWISWIWQITDANSASHSPYAHLTSLFLIWHILEPLERTPVRNPCSVRTWQCLSFDYLLYLAVGIEHVTRSPKSHCSQNYAKHSRYVHARPSSLAIPASTAPRVRQPASWLRIRTWNLRSFQYDRFWHGCR